MSSRRLKIASVCRELPTPDKPTAGLFVLRRLQAMQTVSELKVFQPIPFLHIIRPLPKWAHSDSHVASGTEIFHSPMSYIPRFFKFLDSFWLYRSIYNQLASLKRQKGLDVIDAHFGYPDGVGSLRAGRRLGVPVFVTVRGVELDYLQSPTIGKELRNQLSSAAGCICVSHSLKNGLSEAGVDTSRTCVIHNAVDRELFRPRSRTESRRKLGVPLSSALIVSVGNLLSVKRHDVVIKAFAKIATEMPDAHLTIIGGSTHELDHPRDLRKLCERLGVQEKVTFAGTLSPTEVATWLAAADSFALASDREGCCNALLEALACGIPSVVTSVGDNGYFVMPGENGYLVPVNDSEAFFESLKRTLNRTSWDKDDISSRLKAGSWNTVASQVLDFMNAQINGKSGVNA